MIVYGVKQMTLTANQLKNLPNLKTELGNSKVEHLLSVYFEAQLEKEVSRIFSEMRYQVIQNLTEYYDKDVMFQAHMDLILAPIHELHKKYYETLLKYKIREFDKSREAGKRIVERMINFKRKGNIISKQFTVLKADHDIVSSVISKDKLFGTSEIAHDNLAERTYTLSEKTLARVDAQINDIITKGYEGGNGINSVAHDVTKRFNQLESWEAKRIARTEIHNSHTLGMIQGYDDLGVQYLQWSSAHDNRVRGLKPKDKADHYHLDGEIIPMGGQFSNDLMYPGDMNGKAAEIINCRCSALPFIMPYGYIAPPGMAQFREKDLIATLDAWNGDDIIAQAMSDSRQISVIDEQMINTQKRSESWDIYRLTPQEREVYLQHKKNYLILKEAMENKNYEHLDDLEDLGGFYAIRNKKSFMEYTDNGTDYDWWLKTELKDYLEDINEYETIIKDTNIEVDITPKSINWQNESMKDYKILKDGKYVDVNFNEKFISYHFKKENLTITESVDMDTSRVRHVYQSYKDLPKNMQLSKEIVLSSQRPRLVSLFGNDSYVGGYVTSAKGDTRIVQFKKTVSELRDTVVHESAHLLEKDYGFFISNSKEYVLAFKKDQQRLLSQGYSLEETYVTPYAHNFTEDALNPKSIYYKEFKFMEYREDFAESMKAYLRNKKAFAEKYPEKAKVLEKVINGEFDPKTTVSYRQYKRAEKNRFMLTPEEYNRKSELKWKEYEVHKQGKPLSPSERKELEFYQDKESLNYIYQKMVNGETLDDREYEFFIKATGKWSKELNIGKNVIEELEVSPRARMRQEIRKSKKDLFKLTPAEEKRMNDIKHKLQNEPLGFLEKHRLTDEFEELYSKQYYNKMRNAVIDAHFEEVNWDELEKLHNKFKHYKTAKELKKYDNFKIKVKADTSFEDMNAFHLTDDETEVYTILKNNPLNIQPKQKKILKELQDKEKLGKLHQKLLDENYFDYHGVFPGLDNNETQEYFEIYRKYKSKWKLPDIDIDKIKWGVDVPSESEVQLYLPPNLQRLHETELNFAESEELRKLLIKKNIDKNSLTAAELDRLDYLKTRRDFNEIYSLRVQQKGLFYNEEKIYYKLYHKLAARGQFDHYDVSEQISKFEASPQKIYSPGIKWNEVSHSKYKKRKGSYANGMPYRVTDLTDLFTIDTRYCTEFEKDLAFDWLGSDYRRYREFLVICKGDVPRYAEWLVQNKSYYEAQALNHAMETAFNTTKLCNLLNNQLKEPTTFWRCETKLHLGDDPKVGDVVTFEGFNSFAITKEGMKFFESKSRKTITAYIEIEAPAGTRGAYLAPISPEPYKPEMEFLSQMNTTVEIVELGTMEGKDYAKVRILNQYDFNEVLNSSDIGLKLR
jgi:hypothetical protein